MDTVLQKLVVRLAESARDLPAEVQADLVRRRVHDVIRHLETLRLIPPGDWNLAAQVTEPDAPTP